MGKFEFQLRPATMVDLSPLLAFCHACEEAVAGVRMLTAVRLRGLWTQPGFDVAASTRLAFSQAGEIVGYAAVYDTMNPPVAIGLQLYIHPHNTGNEIGEALLAWAEARAGKAIPRAPADARVMLWTNALHEDTAQIALLKRCGYRRERIHYKMQIDLDQPPPAPAWPVGLAVSSFDTKETLFDALPDVMTAVSEAFQDAWGFVERPLSERVAHWTHRIENNPDFDPTVWYVVREGAEIAGFCLCTPTYDGDAGKAHVNLLGVRRPWRRQGLGLALLRHAFGEFYRRGKRAVDLGVDADSPTRATRLYERAGMRVVRQYDDYEKKLQANAI